MPSAIELRDRLTRVRGQFKQAFGADPAVVARAPGRVELMGSHTDYNLCRVLTLPVDLDLWIAARPRVDRRVTLRSSALDATPAFSLDDPALAASWGRYIQGVARAVADEGLPLAGFDAMVDSTVPLGGGLSSSAALECAAAVLFGALAGWTIDPVRMARICQRAENEFVGVNCGILDQYSACVSGHGGALLLDCRDLTSRPAPMAAGLSVVVCDTRATRALSGSEYSTRRAQCEEGARVLGRPSLRDVTLDDLEHGAGLLSPVVARRCRFIVEEDTRAVRLAEALASGDRKVIGALMQDSFRGACDLFEIGAPAMTAMMTAMVGGPGFVGGRQSGAGFGGCLIAVVAREDLERFAASVTTTYAAASGIQAPVFAVSAGEAAGLVRL